MLVVLSYFRTLKVLSYEGTAVHVHVQYVYYLRTRYESTKVFYLVRK